MAKGKFTDVELEQIKSIQGRLGCSRKTAVKRFTQSQAAAKADVKRAAANDKPEAAPASTMTPEERGKARAESLRLYKLAGRPSKKDFIVVFGPKGVAWTWKARAKALGLTSAEEVASRFQSLLEKAAR